MAAHALASRKLEWSGRRFDILGGDAYILTPLSEVHLAQKVGKQGMPTYEYECTRCGHRFELFQKMSDPPRKRCPKCRGKVQRMLGTGAGILFNGSGFYATDYRSSDYKAAESADKSAASTSKTSSPDSSKASSGNSKDTAGKKEKA